jgi:hypothetical protein
LLGSTEHTPVPCTSMRSWRLEVPTARSQHLRWITPARRAQVDPPLV